jgi:hypothetical protein
METPTTFTSDSPRFVWNIGSISEQFADMPEQPENGSLILFDRLTRSAVVTVNPRFANAICLEITTGTNGAPFTALADWFNGLTPENMESEGLPVTR